ncbi:MAG: hypothetical protein LBH43_05070 [Treponema sp.]|jgi:hypothetical protein|nr:hypothetical protein [Treponema sp.]
MNRIHDFRLDGKEALGFDTGLDSRAFAQAKAAQVLSEPGCLVFPDGRIENWKALGVEENPDGNMTVYGPAFPGKSLMDIICDQARKEEALDAARFWIKAQIFLSQIIDEGKRSVFPGAAGAFIALKNAGDFPAGTVLFPPERLVKRCIEAAGDEAVEAAQRFVHPDLYGEEGAAFSAASMLYAVFCGAPPFAENKALNREAAHEGKVKKTGGRSPLEIMRQDIREGVFLPPELAAPGLDKELSKIINETLSANLQKTKNKKRPSLEVLFDAVGSAGSRGTASWLRMPGEEEIKKNLRKKKQYNKSRNLQVKTRRFVIRNTTIIAVSAAALLILLFGIRGFLRQRAERPNTIGMSPVQVAETYYGAFGPLDHILMEACVLGKAGKEDINLVINLFVLARARQAYEFNSFTAIGAEEWLDAGSPETHINVFGVTGLNIKILGVDEVSGRTEFGAEYTLWLPAAFFPEEDGKPLTLEEMAENRNTPRLPIAFQRRDRLKLVMHKNAWRISEIIRDGF